jgi:hypothetical protein
MADVIPFSLGISKDSKIGWGLVGIVARYDAHSIIKFASTSSNRRFIEIETRIYNRLNDGEVHDGLLKYHGSSRDGIILGYACNNSLRLYMARQGGRRIPLSLRLRWAEQLIATLSFMEISPATTPSLMKSLTWNWVTLQVLRSMASQS